MRTPECAQARTTLFTSPRQSQQQPVPYQAVIFAAKDQIPFSGLPRRADYRRRDKEPGEALAKPPNGFTATRRSHRVS